MDYWHLRLNSVKKNKRYQFQDLILHENDNLIIINKPSGISSLADRDSTAKSVHELAIGYCPKAILCHRLDKFTTGVMLIAKHEAAYRDITLKFQKRLVKKYYHTLIEGPHDIQDQVVDYGIYNNTKGKVRLDNALGKPALTIFNTLKKFRHYTLLECQPVTGRMHQIRLHLLGVGMPVIGDTLYTGKDIFLSDFKRNYKLDAENDERPLNQGFLLHAARIEFAMPGTEEISIFEAPYQPEFQVVLKVLGKWDGY